MRTNSPIRAILAVVLSLIITMSCFTACSASAESDDKLTVVTTIFPPYDFVREIAGDDVDIVLLVKPGSEVHGFDPTLEDIAAICSADLFIYTGGESDQWAGAVLELAESEHMPVRAIAMTDMVATVDEELVEGMQSDEHDHEHEHDHDSDHEHEHEHDHDSEHEHEEEPETDEHVWTSLRNAQIIVDDIANELCGLAPEKSELFRANADDYIARLDELDKRYCEVMERASRNTLVFAERFPFRYLAEDYSLDYFAAFPGCASDCEPSLATIAFLAEKIESEDIPVVFYIEFSKQEVSGAISKATGAKQLELHSCHNLTREEFARGETYLSLMTKNLSVLQEALC